MDLHKLSPLAALESEDLEPIRQSGGQPSMNLILINNEKVEKKKKERKRWESVQNWGSWFLITNSFRLVVTMAIFSANTIFDHIFSCIYQIVRI